MITMVLGVSGVSLTSSNFYTSKDSWPVGFLDPKEYYLEVSART
jgi:hypothetical protein